MPVCAIPLIYRKIIAIYFRHFSEMYFVRFNRGVDIIRVGVIFPPEKNKRQAHCNFPAIRRIYSPAVRRSKIRSLA